jgi:DNA-directed RNA polymerase alpha subunit
MLYLEPALRQLIYSYGAEEVVDALFKLIDGGEIDQWVQPKSLEIENFEPSMRLYNVLKNAMVFTIADAIQVSQDQDLYVRGLGPGLRQELEQRLLAHGYLSACEQED